MEVLLINLVAVEPVGLCIDLLNGIHWRTWKSQGQVSSLLIPKNRAKQ